VFGRFVGPTDEPPGATIAAAGERKAPEHAAPIAAE
jgi:hypothetical protein